MNRPSGTASPTSESERWARAAKADQHVVEQLAVDKPLDHQRDDGRERRDDRGIDRRGLGGGLPGEKKQRHAAVAA